MWHFIFFFRFFYLHPLLQLTESADYVLGLFAASHIPYNIEKKSDSDKPSLEEMLGKALDVLEKDKKGFFLFVEGKAFFS